jgi:hypothetical protein
MNPTTQHLNPPGTPDGPPPMPEDTLPNEVTAAPRLNPREALTHYERILEQSLARKAEMAMALLAISERKLYKLTHPSIAGYLKERWKLSRARGYQLLRFAKALRCCLQKGQPPPANGGLG